ncbi:isocitrate dehydrogenase, partial [Striga asiatica]
CLLFRMDRRPILYRPYLGFFLMLHGWQYSPMAVDRYSVDTCSRQRSPTHPDPTRWIILLRKPSFFDWSFSSAAASVSILIRANVFPGDGIGPHIAKFVKQSNVVRSCVMLMIYLIVEGMTLSMEDISLSCSLHCLTLFHPDFCQLKAK